MSTDTYTVALADDAQVPMTAPQIAAAYAGGALRRHTLIWRPGMEQWASIETYAGELGVALRALPVEVESPAPVVRKPVQSVPVAAQLVHVQPAPNGQGGVQNIYIVQQGHPAGVKSRGFYAFLGIFFGTLGLHNFYASYAVTGIVQLFVTLFLGLRFPPLIVLMFLANIIEVIVTSKDASGVTMN